jgi:hypothetical protein
MTLPHPLRTILFLTLVAVPFAPSCACGEVASEDEARIAYLGVDNVVTKGLALGFDGFNAASNATIPAQSDTGEVSGDIVVTGQIDQGGSTNKGMRLFVALTDYSDGSIDDPLTEDEEEIDILYNTEDTPLTLNLKLRSIPDGTLEDGILKGSILMTGDLEGPLTLDIIFSGQIRSDGNGGTERVPGSTTVTGTAEGRNGTFDINTTI